MSQLKSNDATLASASHRTNTESPPEPGVAEWILGSDGSSVMSTSRWPLESSRSAGQLSRNQMLKYSLTRPSAHSMTSELGVDEMCRGDEALFMAASLRKKDDARQRFYHWRAIEYYTGTFDVSSVPEQLFTDDLLDRAIGQASVGG